MASKRKGAGRSSAASDSSFEPDDMPKNRGRKRLPVPEDLEALSDEERRRVLRRDRNRANAQASRARKVQRMEALENEIAIMKQENELLQEALASVTQQLKAALGKPTSPSTVEKVERSHLPASPHLATSPGNGPVAGSSRHHTDQQQQRQLPMVAGEAFDQVAHRSGSLGLSGLKLRENKPSSNLPTTRRTRAVPPSRKLPARQSKQRRTSYATPEQGEQDLLASKAEELAAAALAEFSHFNSSSASPDDGHSHDDFTEDAAGFQAPTPVSKATTTTRRVRIVARSASLPSALPTEKHCNNNTGAAGLSPMPSLRVRPKPVTASPVTPAPTFSNSFNNLLALGPLGGSPGSSNAFVASLGIIPVSPWAAAGSWPETPRLQGAASPAVAGFGSGVGVEQGGGLLWSQSPFKLGAASPFALHAPVVAIPDSDMQEPAMEDVTRMLSAPGALDTNVLHFRNVK